MINPGILGLYWAAATFTATAAWIGACHLARRTARHTCPCGGHR